MQTIKERDEGKDSNHAKRKLNINIGNPQHPVAKTVYYVYQRVQSREIRPKLWQQIQ